MQNNSTTITTRQEIDIKHFHLFCGLGGGAKGFNEGCKGTVLDLFTREQYTAFHGKAPDTNWREATADDIRKAAGNETPNIVFLSAPCKSFSGLLSQALSVNTKYQALNELPMRGIWLMLEAFVDNLPELIIFENVPRIATRGRKLLDRIVTMLEAYGYAVAETFHDCGEIGGLAQSRKRFLMVARHIAKVPPFLYEPPKRRLLGVGEILGKMPLPGHPAGGPMHRVPNLHWSTWVRLAFVESGKDWRSLKRLNVKDGYLSDYLLVPEHNFGAGYLGVNEWDKNSGTIAGCSRVGNGPYAVADPRSDTPYHHGCLGVNEWNESTGVVTGPSRATTGNFSVADPRMPETNPNRHDALYRVEDWGHASHTVTGAVHSAGGGLAIVDPRHQGDPKFNNCFRIVEWKETSPAVTGGTGPSGGGLGVADPRTGWDRHSNNLSVVDWETASPTVIAGGKGVQGGWLSVADPRSGLNREKGDNYLTAGHYGVVPWETYTGAVSASGQHDNGAWSVADPRLPAKTDKMVAVIRSLDNTWHRPFTTLELAALQSLIDPEEYLELDGQSDSRHRQAIGNAVPAQAAKAIADTIAHTLLLAWSGETFALNSLPIWVRPVAVALSVKPALSHL